MDLEVSRYEEPPRSGSEEEPETSTSRTQGDRKGVFKESQATLVCMNHVGEV
jgi:hypothetical protein